MYRFLICIVVSNVRVLFSFCLPRKKSKNLLKMSVDSLKSSLRKCNGDEFFKNIEKYLGCQIPINIKNVLKVNVYDNAYAMSILNDNQYKEMEEFIRCDFNSDMLGENQTAADFLGIYEKNRAKFKFVSGEKALMKNISKECLKLYEGQERVTTITMEDSIASAQQSQYLQSQVNNSQGLEELLPQSQEATASGISKHVSHDDLLLKYYISAGTENIINELFDNVRKWMSKQNTFVEVKNT